MARLRDMNMSELKDFLASKGVDPKSVPGGIKDRHQLFLWLLDHLPIEAVASLDEIQSHPSVRKDVLSDITDALRGDMVEADREEAAAAQAQLENDTSPTREELDRLEAPPVLVPTFGADGSTVESVMVTKWIQGDDGRPVNIEMAPDELP